MTRIGQVWRSVYHDEVFLILRSWPSGRWITHEVLSLSSVSPKKQIHNFDEQHVGYWDESPVMDRLL